MNQDVQKGYHLAQLDILCRLMKGFTYPERMIAYFAEMTGLDEEEVEFVVQKKIYEKKDKIYAAYYAKCDSKEELLLRLYMAGLDKEYLVQKFQINQDDLDYLWEKVPNDVIEKVYNDLMQEKERNEKEECFCRDYTIGYIVGRIQGTQNTYTKIKKANMPEEEILYYLTTTKEKLEQYLAMAETDIRQYARKVVEENIDKETYRLKVPANKILY